MRICITVGSIIAGMVLGFLLFYSIAIRSSKDVTIPTVRGLNCMEASKKLVEMGFNVVTGVGSFVLGTYPAAGMSVKSGRTIKIFCKRDIETFDLEKLRGSSVVFAKDVIETLGMRVEVHRFRFRGDLGKVLDYRVVDGTVHLLIDVGSVERYGIVPPVVGLSLKDAVEAVKERGLNCEITGEGNFVVDQFPEPGSVATGVLLKTE